MEKIKLEFSVTPCIVPMNGINVVIMTLDEKGKIYRVEKEGDILADIKKGVLGEQKEKQEELPSIPKRVLAAFTENAINKILSKDEIPNESSFVVLDGCSYDIKITKGNIRKEYYADEASIETYPLLRYLASWCRKL